MSSKYLVFVFLLTSCATLRNKKTYNLNIVSCENDTKVIYKDSTYSLPLKLNLKRTRKPLYLTAVSDSLTRQYKINAKLSLEYGAGNLVFMAFPPATPLGYLFDLTNPKRYYYGKELNINATDTTSVTLHRVPFEKTRSLFSSGKSLKGNTYFHYSIPFVNGFYFEVPTQGVRHSTGLMGLSAGFEHFYKERRALGFNVGMIAQLPDQYYGSSYQFPFIENYETMQSFFFTGYEKHQIKKFSYSYGISYTVNRWTQEHHQLFAGVYGQTSRKIISNQSLGLEVAGYFYVNPVVHFGVVYRPTIVDLNAGMVYQHVISFDVAFRFNTRK